MGARPSVDPGVVRRAAGDGDLHQVVIGRVIGDLVDPAAVAVEGAQFRDMPVGLLGLLEHRVAAHQPAECREAAGGASRAFPRHRFAQRDVAGPQILVADQRRHVDDLVGRQVGDGFERDHPSIRFRRGRLRQAAGT